MPNVLKRLEVKKGKMDTDATQEDGESCECVCCLLFLHFKIIQEAKVKRITRLLLCERCLRQPGACQEPPSRPRGTSHILSCLKCQKKFSQPWSFFKITYNLQRWQKPLFCYHPYEIRLEPGPSQQHIKINETLPGKGNVLHFHWCMIYICLYNVLA